jgi:hypothetical protein
LSFSAHADSAFFIEDGEQESLDWKVEAIGRQDLGIASPNICADDTLRWTAAPPFAHLLALGALGLDPY